MNGSELRVLMTADTIGGVWTYSCELIRALAPFGVRVTLATMGQRMSRTQARSIAALSNVDVFESNYRLEWMDDAWADIDAAGEWLLSIAQRTSPDIVHVNGYAHAALGFAAPVLVVAHSCVCTWHRAVRGRDAGYDWNTYRARVAAGLRGARAIVAPTQAVLRAVLREYNIEAAGSVIPNGCDPTNWPRGDKEPFAISVGRMWDEAKNLGDLDACAAKVTWPIYIAGSTQPPGGPAVQPRGAKSLGELPPDLLSGWLSRASIYVHPARYEPFGLSCVEAALAGCALVVGDIETLREVWGDAALYVKAGDPDALAAAIEGLARDPLRRRMFAASARKRALAFSPDRMAEAYYVQYTQLVGHPRRTEVA